MVVPHVPTMTENLLITPQPASASRRVLDEFSLCKRFFFYLTEDAKILKLFSLWLPGPSSRSNKTRWRLLVENEQKSERYFLISSDFEEISLLKMAFYF